MSLKHDPNNEGRMIAPLSRKEITPMNARFGDEWMAEQERSNHKPALSGEARHIVTTNAWREASESQRREWALAVLETLRDAYGELRLDDRLAVKRALADARGEL